MKKFFVLIALVCSLSLGCQKADTTAPAGSGTGTGAGTGAGDGTGAGEHAHAEGEAAHTDDAPAEGADTETTPAAE